MSDRLTLQDLTDLLAEKQGITKKDAEVFLRELFILISENIEQNNSVKIKDFGTFKLVKVNSRKSVDVNTGDAIEIPAHYKLSFTPEKSLRDLLNAPFAHFESVVIEDGVNFENVKFEPAADTYPLDKDEDPAENVSEEVTVNDNATVAEEESPANIQEQQETAIEIEDLIEENKEEAPLPDSVDNENAKEIVDETPLIPEENIVEEPDSLPPTPPEPPASASTVEDEDEDLEYLYEDEHHGRKWLIVAVLFFAVIAIALFWYRDEFFGSKDDSSQKPDLIETPNIQSPDSASLVMDSVSTSESGKNEDKTKSEDDKGDKSKITESTSQKDYKPKDIIKLEKGQTLRLLALKYYGNKSFWVYIYQENKDKIPNFNNIQIGQKLVIPANEKYGIDVSDAKSLSKAKALEDKYFR